MHVELSALCRLVLKKGEKALEGMTSPVLIWAMPTRTRRHEYIPQRTQAPGVPAEAWPINPLVFEVKRNEDAARSFEGAVTVGRSQSNDVVLDHHSVSRSHAFFVEDRSGCRWMLTDTGSYNGTCVQGQRLEPNSAVEVPDEALVRFGELEMEFLLPPTFHARLLTLARPSS